MPPKQLAFDEQARKRLKEGVDIPVLECLRNLGEISKPRFFLVALPLAVKGLDACPVRALALED